MRSASILPFLLGSLIAAPLDLPPLWGRTGVAAPTDGVHLIVAVKYRVGSTERLKRELLTRSDPISDPGSYGQWLTLDEIDAFLKPSEESIDAVSSWLGHSINDTALWSKSGSFVRVDVSASRYTVLTGLPLTKFQHESGAISLRVDSDACTLPSSVARHIDVISPGCGRLPPQPRSLAESRQLQPPPPAVRITPDLIRKMYNLTDQVGLGLAGRNTQATANFLRQSVQQSDLDKFMNNECTQCKVRTAMKIVGRENPADPGIEAMLDSEFIMGVGRDTSTEWWFTDGGQPGNPQDEPWLAWLANLANTSDADLPLVFSAS